MSVMVIYNKKKRPQQTHALRFNVLSNSIPSASVYFSLLTALEEANLWSVYMLFPQVRCWLSCFYGSIMPENDIISLSIALI